MFRIRIGCRYLAVYFGKVAASSLQLSVVGGYEFWDRQTADATAEEINALRLGHNRAVVEPVPSAAIA